MGRTSRGVRALRLAPGDQIIGSAVIGDDEMVLTITEPGYGKATQILNYRVQNRGGKGIKNINITAKNGNVVGISKLGSEDLSKVDLLIITELGAVIRIPGKEIKISNRATQGVRLMKMNDGDKVPNCEIIDSEDVSREPVEFFIEER